MIFTFGFSRAMLGLAVVTISLAVSGSNFARGQTGPTLAARASEPRPAERAPQPGDLACAQSRVFIHVFKTGLGHEHAVEGKIESGSLRLGAPERAGQMIFDMQSFDADTPLARKYLSLAGHTDDETRKQVNDNMHSAKVLDSKRFPTATFEIESALPRPARSPDRPEQYVLSGKFTLRGVQKPATMVIEVDQEEHGFLHVRGQFTIKQTDFGMKPYTAALGAVGVADHLEIHGDAWIKSDRPIAEASTPARRPR